MKVVQVNNIINNNGNCFIFQLWGHRSQNLLDLDGLQTSKFIASLYNQCLMAFQLSMKEDKRNKKTSTVLVKACIVLKCKNLRKHKYRAFSYKSAKWRHG